MYRNVKGFKSGLNGMGKDSYYLNKSNVYDNERGQGPNNKLDWFQKSPVTFSNPSPMFRCFKKSILKL